MKAALLWTINDFPARSSLSGWSGQGYYACPTCNVDTPSMAVKNKIAYVGHRRFLRTRHPQRSKFKEYYGSKEPTPKPRKFSELEIQLQITFYLLGFLEVLAFLKLKHNLDVMHIEKNALEALLNTLLQNDKTKDTDDVETRFNRLGRNDDGLPEEEPNKFQGSCMFCTYNIPEVDADILAYIEKSPDNVETNFPAWFNHKMACVFPRSHGGDAGGSPPRRPNRPVPAQCESSNLRIETGNASLRRAFRQNDQRPLTIGFDYGDLGTFHPTGDYSSMLNSLMGETVKYLPLACEWEEIPEAYKAHIFPTLESYFDLASWYNNQDKVVMGNNVYTVGDRVKLGLQLKLRILWRKNKQRIKADHFTRYGSVEEARNHLPPNKVWGDRTKDEWNNLVDWWSHPDRVARSLQNAANRAKNTILTHQGKKSFAQGRNEYKVQKGHYEDLIETWRKTHSRPETGEFKTQKNLKRYLDMKSMQDQVRAGVIPYKTDQDILDEVVPSTNRQNMSGKGRKLPGGGSTSRRRGPQAFPDPVSREELDRILRQKDQEAELLRKQTAEAQQRAYLAALKADAVYQNSETMYGAIGKQHRASCKTKAFNPITKPLFMLHMDLFGPTFVSSLMHKKYCLVVTDDYSRFSWVFFLTTKDETSEILKNFIKEVENLVDKKVKIIRSDNGTEFKNKVMDDFCREKGIKREYSVARTPQQNGVAERKNRTLIEAARTMLADSKLPTTFWAEAVSTACYVQNRVLIVKPHNKTPYELFRGFKPAIGFMKPFGCHVTILNTLDNLGKFDEKSDEGFFVGYSLSSKAFRVYNIRTRKVQENLHIGFLENKPMIEGNGPKWLFDLDSLTQSMNYVPVVAGKSSNDFAGIQGVSESSTSSQQDQDWIVMPIWKDASYFGDASPKTVDDAQIEDKDELHDEDDATEESHDGRNLKENGTADPQVNTVRPDINNGSREVSTALPEVNTATPEDLVGPSPASEDSHVEDKQIKLGNIPQSYEVSTTPHIRSHKDHPIEHEKEVEKLILKNEEERELGLHLLRFTEVLGEACKVAMPHILCDYLYYLCKKFNSLYPSVFEVVWSGEKIGEETSKLLLCEATRVVMKKCFYFVGITPIHKI
ncbi:putative ribonuclease H-like domain-containing protein [Tanacetum coccineum]|uniref:Ribonuclease H-like domain-containing protein n=1 Tax=Tanacetum coccineum TaxID=301880 RepID=A0ABQ5D360_9ASTR